MRNGIYSNPFLKTTNDCLAAPLGQNCGNAIVFGAVVGAINRGATAALFLVRVLVVYPRNRLIKALFIVLWCAAVGGGISSIPFITAVKIEPTKYCIAVITSSWKVMVASMMGADAIFDILACVAIMYQMRNYWVGGENDGIHEHSRWLCFPARRNSKLADRFTRDSQTYVL